MNSDIAIVLLILVGAILLFASERIRVDVVSLLVLVALALTRLLDFNDVFSGFSNPAVVTVWAIYMLSDGINRTGIADVIGERILRVTGHSEARLIAGIMITVGALSAFTNNIGATAILMPAVIQIGQKADISPSKLLIPLAFGSLLGGVTTLIGTPPNLLVNAALQDAGYESFRLLDFTPMGLIILATSVLYMVFIGRHLLPVRKKSGLNLGQDYNLRNYLCELYVPPDSPLVGKTVLESKVSENFNLALIGRVRQGKTTIGLTPDMQILARDKLLVKAPIDDLLAAQKELKIQFDPAVHPDIGDILDEETQMAEVVVTQHAGFAGKSVREADFRNEFGINVLALWHEERPFTTSTSDIALQLGDVLLISGRKERIAALRLNNQFLLLGPLNLEWRRTHKAPLALAIFVAIIALVAAGKLHISVAAVTVVVLYLLTNIINMEEAYNAVEWKSIFLIAGMLPLGIAMDKTGAAEYLADIVISWVGGWGPRGIMVGLFILTTLLTGFMSNAAAAVLVAPIAISTAVSLGISPKTFVMGVGIAASNAFVLPVGHQANILVYGPGGYKFFDYTKVGVPLTLLIWLLLLIFLPMIFPF